MPAAIIPHYDNADGANHDTRFCYIGERRLRVMEAVLPPEVFIIGVDEAGRGPLAGSVVAGAVVLDPNKPIEGLKDSKKLSSFSSRP